MRETDKIICMECGAKLHYSELDLVPDPNPPPNTEPEVWRVCPKCRIPEQLEPICDEPGCWERSSGGTPTSEGYRWTCYKHHPKDPVCQKSDSANR